MAVSEGFYRRVANKPIRNVHPRPNDGDAIYAARVMVMPAMAEEIRAVSLVVKWAG